MASFLTGGIQSAVTTLNQPQFRALVAIVVTAGTPVQLPDIPIPDGVKIGIRAKVTNGNKRIFLADSQASVGLANFRIELRAGEAIALAITNTNLIWIDASGNNTAIEILVEA